MQQTKLLLLFLFLFLPLLPCCVTRFHAGIPLDLELLIFCHSLILRFSGSVWCINCIRFFFFFFLIRSKLYSLLSTLYLLEKKKKPILLH